MQGPAAGVAHSQHASCVAQESDEAQADLADLSAETPGEAPGDEGATGEAEDEQPDLEAPLLVAGEGEDSDEKQALPAPTVDRSLLGLGLYALSGCFLSTMLVLTKKLSALPTLACFGLPRGRQGGSHAHMTRLRLPLQTS